MTIRHHLVVLMLVLVTCLGAASLWGQTAVTGALTVTVSDPTGAVVPNAMVTLTSPSGSLRTGTTGANGGYTFSLLDPGNYGVTITAAGFKTVSVTSVTVNVTETHVLTQTLEVGATQQEVTVQSEVQTVQTETAALGGVVGSEQVVDLPLVTRNYTQIMALSPGVIADAPNATLLGRGSQLIYVNGTDNISTQYLQDGVNVSNYASAVAQDVVSFYGSIPIPNPDAIQEFKVQTSTYDASYGKSGGGNVNVVTKSGTDQLHGSAFEFFRNDALNANTFFGNKLGAPRGKFEQNQFGGTLGGPIQKDKLFVFGSYQGTKQINGVAAQGSSTVNLPPQLTNNRTAAALGAAFCTVPTYSPTSTPNPASDQVACNGSNINPVALAILNAHTQYGTYYIPSPTAIISSTLGQSYFSIPAYFSEKQFIGNLDYVINPKETFSVKYFYSIAPQIQAFNNTAGQPAGGGIATLSGDQLVSARLTSILSNNFVNEFQFSSYYLRSSIDSLDIISAASVGTVNPGPFSVIPVLNFSFPGFTTVGGSSIDQERPPQQIYEVGDQTSWSHGRHTIRVGYDEQYVQWTQRVASYSRATLSFRSFSDFLLGESAAQNGTGLSNIYSTSAQIQAPGGTHNANVENNLGTYVQDDFKVNSRLTLNMGLRWDYLGFVTDHNYKVNGATNPEWFLDESVPIPPVGGTYVGYTVGKGYFTAPTGVVQRGVNVLPNNLAPYNNFAPRFGFAWQPTGDGKLVVRGGYGLFFDLMMGNIFEIELNADPPSSGPVSYTGAVNAAATLANPTNPIPAPGWAGFIRTQTSALTENGVNPYENTPYIEAYNLNVQYEFKPTWVLQVGYSGSHYVHISTGRADNEPILATPTSPVNCGALAGCITTNTSSNAAQRVPVLGIAPGKFAEAGNFGFGKYNALQVILRKTISHGLMFQASYTYGTDYTNVIGVSQQAGVAGTINQNDPDIKDASYGRADYYRPQRITINYIYNFPSFHSGEGLAGRALTGWGLSGVTTAQAGLPVTFIDSAGGAVYGSFSSARAELCPGATISQIPTSGSTVSRLSDYWNATPFCAEPIVGAFAGTPASPGASGYGDSPRNPLLGPGQFNWDAAIVKDTRVGGVNEGATLQFRAEFFNTFNHPNFSNPGATLSNGKPTATFGVITTASNGPRILQFALKYSF